MAKKIAVLGSTGSVGEQSLDVIKREGYEVCALCAGQSAKKLAMQALDFLPPVLAMQSEDAAEELRGLLAGHNYSPQIFTGSEAAQNAAICSGADIVLNAIVGIAGLSTTLAALDTGIDVALANKESLVTGGKLVMDAAKKAGKNILPVDSEHSAIFQCLQGVNIDKEISRIILTASGGPFYGRSKTELEEITQKEALAHPNWSMGPKISIDSATMMNKGLEFIEAMWLFDIDPKKIDIVVQKQSIIHSMVEFCDNSILAQMAVPDMRLPIQYALTWPKRCEAVVPKLDFAKISELSFGVPDEDTFCALRACKTAAQKGGLAPCAANGANEEAVALFLRGEIGFLDIGYLVEAFVQSDSFAGGYDIKDVYDCDAAARRYVNENK